MPSNSSHLPKNLVIGYSSNQQKQRIDALKVEMLRKYSHLNLRFFPDSICMQAKISIKTARHQSLLIDPGLYADILCTESFIAENFVHHSRSSSRHKDGQQYILNSTTLEKLGHSFVLKATFGPSFLSLWFRNESSCDTLELPLCHALEILNKLHHRFQKVSTSELSSNELDSHDDDKTEANYSRDSATA